jgi:hypothetical protein
MEQGSALGEEALIPRVVRARRREDVLATIGEFTLQPPTTKGHWVLLHPRTAGCFAS